jgi:cytoskeleton protein RodZ
MPALGERFRAAREARGLTLSDVAEQIRIRSVYLAAIEDENWTAIGAAVYVRGFLRTYARFLGLDPEETVAVFNQAASASPPPTQATPTTSFRADMAAPVRQLSGLIWVASAVAVILIAFLVYNEATWHQRQKPVTTADSSTAAAASVAATGPVPASPSALPSDSPLGAQSTVPSSSPSPAASGSTPPGGPHTLEVRLTAASWLRVTVDGNVSMVGTFPAGTDRLFRGKNATLRIGNAGGVEIVVDGKSRGTLGATGAVVERSLVL